MSLSSSSLPSLEFPKRFRIVSQLGAGGSGIVLRAFDEARSEEVALKVVGRAEAPWLLNEFHLLRSVRHENLIRVFDIGGLPSGHTYYTMELVDGSDLGHQCKGPMPEDFCRLVVVGVLRGLGHLHCHGLLHADLKPANILLGRGDSIKIADMGMGLGATEAQSSGGTPGYTAPEIWLGEEPSVKSDLYSLGVIVYEALTGEHPFGGRTIREVVAGQLEGWVASPRARGVELSHNLERAVMRALERDPYLRFGSADEFLEELGASGPGEIVGGRFVGREHELEALTEFIQSQSVGAPTVLYLAGPAGSGKTALVQEVIARMGPEAVRFEQLSEPEHDIPRLLDHLEGLGLPSELTSTGVSRLSDALIRRFDGATLVGVEDPPGPGDVVRRIARYVWAEAEERRCPPAIRFVRIGETAPNTLERHEASIQVLPVDDVGARAIGVGLLGNTEPAPHFWVRLRAEVGGTPGAITGAVMELVSQGLIRREFGQWKVQDPSDKEWSLLSRGVSTLGLSLARLAEAEHDVLTAVCLVYDGLTDGVLGRILPGDPAVSLSRLVALGWLTRRGDSYFPSSQDAVRLVLAPSNGSRIKRVSQALLGKASGLSREALAMLQIEDDATTSSLNEGLWLACELRRKGQYARALELLTKVRQLASQRAAREPYLESTLLEAEMLNLVGSPQAALELPGWAEQGTSPAFLARSAMTRGESLKLLGQLDKAKEEFANCARWAKATGDLRLMCAAEAELAELTWRYGGEAGRSAAIMHVKELLESVNGIDDLEEEIAGLQYQLGAALVVSGEREPAIAVLTEALNRAKSHYWRMRACNALNAAYYYLGDLRTALAVSDRAWSHAVDGGIDSFKPRLLAGAAGIRFGLGLFREAVTQGEMSAAWGRRLGSPFEYEAGLLAAASDLIQIAEFERALDHAKNARSSSSEDPRSRHTVKGLEIEALSLLHIGDYGRARQRAEEACSRLEPLGYDDTLPRLRWHLGRIALEEQDYGRAEESLRLALADLERTQDWEDLPGVQVEMQVLFARAGDKRLDIEQLLRVLRGAQSRELCPVQLRAVLALAEVSYISRGPVGSQIPILEDGLRLAERCGAREFVWRISYWICKELVGVGEARAAAVRIGNAVRVLRGVASELTIPNQRLYLSTAHARLLLDAAALKPA